MSSVGGIGVFSVESVLPRAGLITEKKVRPGVTGFDIVEQGTHGESKPVLFKAAYTSNFNRENALDAFMALQGFDITIVDDLGVSKQFFLVDRIGERNEPNGRRPRVNGTSGLNYWLYMEMEVTPH